MPFQVLREGFSDGEPVSFCFLAAERFGDLGALGGGGSVAPEFGGADDVAGGIERDETMLLAADADGFDFGGDGFGGAQRLPDGGGGGFAPGIRMLLLRAGREIGDQFVSLRARAEDFAVLGVHDEGFGGLRAAINADQKVAHEAEDSREFNAVSRRRNMRWRILHEVFRVGV